ncbi:sigma factor-like helix-turn-helix DNA-binding protein [Arthrobacter sp. MW3 TE3886]
MTEDLEKVIRMRASGRTVAEIARLMLTSERTVRRALSETTATNER